MNLSHITKTNIYKKKILRFVKFFWKMFRTYSVKWQIIEHMLLSCSANNLLWYVKAPSSKYPIMDFLWRRRMWQVLHSSNVAPFCSWTTSIDKNIFQSILRQINDTWIYNWRTHVNLTCRWCLYLYICWYSDLPEKSHNDIAWTLNIQNIGISHHSCQVVNCQYFFEKIGCIMFWL